MKTAVSIQDAIFKSADVLAHRLGMSRSELYQNAIAEFLAKHQAKKVTERLDAVYAHAPEKVARDVRRMQARSIPDERW